MTIEILPKRIISRYYRLQSRLEDMNTRLRSSKYAPDLPLDRYAASLVCGLSEETYRLMSRNRFARALPRPVDGAPMSHGEALTTLRAILLAMDVFRERHRYDFDDYDVERMPEDDEDTGSESYGFI